MQEVECAGCGWRGKWEDVIHSVSDMDAVIEGREERKDYCPVCHSEELIDLDAVGPNDYQSQNPLERTSE